MSNILQIVLWTCAFIRFFVLAEIKEDLKQKFSQHVLECSKEFPLSAANLQEFKTGKVPDDEKVRCMLACTYKKVGMMDEEGQLSVDGLRKLSEQFYADNPEKIKKSNDFTQACISVNDMPVSDGTKGCERAALIFKCSMEKAPEFDFV